MLLTLFSDSEKPNKELLYWSVSFVSFNMVLNNFTSKLKIDKGKGEKAPSLLVLDKPSKSGAVAAKKTVLFPTMGSEEQFGFSSIWRLVPLLWLTTQEL